MLPLLSMIGCATFIASDTSDIEYDCLMSLTTCAELRVLLLYALPEECKMLSHTDIRLLHDSVPPTVDPANACNRVLPACVKRCS